MLMVATRVHVRVNICRQYKLKRQHAKQQKDDEPAHDET